MKKLQTVHKSSGGFTLIEVLVAMVILSIGVLALTSMQTAGMKGNSTANVLTVGGTWVASTIEEIFGTEYDDLANGNTTTVDGKYTVTWTVTDDSPMPDTKSVNLIVAGQDKQNQRRVEVDYIKAKYVN